MLEPDKSALKKARLRSRVEWGVQVGCSGWLPCCKDRKIIPISHVKAYKDKD